MFCSSAIGPSGLRRPTSPSGSICQTCLSGSGSARMLSERKNQPSLFSIRYLPILLKPK